MSNIFNIYKKHNQYFYAWIKIRNFAPENSNYKIQKYEKEH